MVLHAVTLGVGVGDPIGRYNAGDNKINVLNDSNHFLQSTNFKL
jgi:hypothetical protein